MKEYKPGECIEVEIEFAHDQVLKDVSLIYRKTEDRRSLVALKTESSSPIETERKEGVSSFPSYVSTVVLTTQVDNALHVPGTYELSDIKVETYSGNHLTNQIEDAGDPDTQAFKILEEPTSPPDLLSLRIT
jgi:hypothetical protein